jgi:hypothetical protein
MRQGNLWLLLIGLVLLAAALLFGTGPAVTGEFSLPEQDIVELPLAGPLADRNAEISGLAWAGDNLVLLPQYPSIFDEAGDGFLYYLPRNEIEAFLDGSSQTPLEPRAIQLLAPDLEDQISGFQGFESMGFSDSRVFLTIESGFGNKMLGFLISGTLSPDLSVLLLDTDKLTRLEPQSSYENLTDESILVFDDRVVTFFEANGELIVSKPVAHVFDHDLNLIDTVPMTNLEYRLTDTALVSEHEFWGINYLFPGDAYMIPFSDPIADIFGKGASQRQFAHVERLVKLQYTDAGVILLDTRPVSLSLVEDARNWEGLAVLDDRGFLVATDKFPATILAFVPMP